MIKAICKKTTLVILPFAFLLTHTSCYTMQVARTDGAGGKVYIMFPRLDSTRTCSYSCMVWVTPLTAGLL
jgi:hypothetical protein